MVTVIIVAAGVGKRMKSEVPKQFLSLKGKPILAHTLSCFQRAAVIDQIVLVVNRNWQEESRQIASFFNKVAHIVAGGKRRQDSVWAGLQVIKEGIVLVHDGVRPFVTPTLIEGVVRATEKWGAVVPALPAKETVKWVETDVVKKTLPREFIYLVQTPQGFRYELLKEAYLRLGDKEDVTDDASLVEQLGMKVHVIAGEPFNLKITTPEDCKWAEMILSLR